MSEETKASPAGSVLEVGGKAALGGAAVASILGLARMLAESNRQKRKEEERRRAQAGNTIVFHIKKRAEDGCGECGSCDGTHATKVESLVERTVRPVSNERQLREVNGRFTDIANGEPEPSEKKADFITNTAAGTGRILAAIGGGVLGYAVVEKIARKAEQNRLKRQISAAQQEYIDLLGRQGVKNAEAFSALFSIGDGTDEAIESLEKEAGIFKDVVGAAKGATTGAQHLSSAALAAYILLAGGSAVATKKLLEKRFDPPEQEEPEEQTRVVMVKDSEGRDIPVPADRMLATVWIMRDCIADSMAPFEKKAANYGFLDEISGKDGGKQFLLDLYAKQNGLKHSLLEGDRKFSVPVSTAIKYSRTIGDVMRHPEKHTDAINSHVMKMMQKDPVAWFSLLGDARNKDIVDLKANQAIQSQSGGLYGIPLVGDLMRSFAKWYATNSKYGRKEVASKTLGQMGVTGPAAKNILDRFDFSSGGWTQKAAGVLSDIVAWSAQTKTISDKSNKDILKAIENLREEQSPKKKPAKPGKGNRLVSNKSYVVELSPDVAKMLSPEDRKRILSAFEA